MSAVRLWLMRLNEGLPDQEERPEDTDAHRSPLRDASTKGSPIKRSDDRCRRRRGQRASGLNEGLPDQEERQESKGCPRLYKAKPQRRAPRSRGATLPELARSVAVTLPQRRAPRSRGATNLSTDGSTLWASLNEGLPDQEERPPGPGSGLAARAGASTKGSPIKRSDRPRRQDHRGLTPSASTKGSPIKRSDATLKARRVDMTAAPQRRAPRSRGATPPSWRTRRPPTRGLNEGLPDQEERLPQDQDPGRGGLRASTKGSPIKRSDRLTGLAVASACPEPQRRAPRSRGATVLETRSMATGSASTKGSPIKRSD